MERGSSDRDCLGRDLGRLRRFHTTRGEYEIDRKVSEFRSKGSQTLSVASGKSVFENDVDALDPAEFAQFLSERRVIDGGPIERRKMPNPVDLPRFILLSLRCGKRRESKDGSKNDEPDQPHGHLG